MLSAKLQSKLRFRQAHRRDTVSIHAVGALRLSAETVALRKIYRKDKIKAHRALGDWVVQPLGHAVL